MNYKKFRELLKECGGISRLWDLLLFPLFIILLILSGLKIIEYNEKGIMRILFFKLK